jgi:hypothetical protein
MNGIPESQVHVMFDITSLLRTLFFVFSLALAIEQL